MTPREQLTKARAGLVLDAPFFASLALRLTIIEDPTCQTAWTDGTHLGYNPKFIAGLRLDETKGLLAHEVSHCAAKHHLRRQQREKKKWNTAGDYVINKGLISSGFVLPEGGLRNPALADKSTEAVYAMLPDEPEDSGGGKGKGKGKGSGTNGKDKSDPGGCGEVRDAKRPDGQPMSKADLAEAEGQWNRAVIQAAQSAKAHGKLPAGFDRLIDEIVNPKVDWKEILWRFVNQLAKNDYRWSPPNRRYVAQGLYLPSIRSDEMPPFVFVCDTSGSIVTEQMDDMQAEISAILESFQDSSCTVIHCDAGVASIEEFSTDDLPIRLHPKGGGGTDFRPAFDYIEKNNLDPACVIYMTDLDGRFPDVPPSFPVLWIKTGDHVKGDAPFGETIHLN